MLTATLYGRNTTGGAISIYTRKPTLAGAPSGYAEIGAGNHDRHEARSALDLTLDKAEPLGLRVAGSFTKSDGLMQNLTSHPRRGPHSANLRRDCAECSDDGQIRHAGTRRWGISAPSTSNGKLV